MITKAIKKVSEKLMERKVNQYRERIKEKTHELYRIFDEMQKETSPQHTLAAHLEVIGNFMVFFRIEDRPFIVDQVLNGIRNTQVKIPIGLKRDEPTTQEIGYVA